MRLRRVSSEILLAGEHCYLNCADECYFATPYECNWEPGLKQLVIALKRCQPRAIEYVSEQLKIAIRDEWAENYTFVPMPRSSCADNAIKAILRKTRIKDSRDLLCQTVNTPASHDGWHPSPSERAELFSVNELLSSPKPSAIAIVDDVLTTGAHFSAAKYVLNQRWPEINVIGVFLARVCLRKQRCGVVRTNGSSSLCGLHRFGSLPRPDRVSKAFAARGDFGHVWLRPCVIRHPLK